MDDTILDCIHRCLDVIEELTLANLICQMTTEQSLCNNAVH